MEQVCGRVWTAPWRDRQGIVLGRKRKEVNSYPSKATCHPTCDQSESTLSNLAMLVLVPILPNRVSNTEQDAGERVAV